MPSFDRRALVASGLALAACATGPAPDSAVPDGPVPESDAPGRLAALEERLGGRLGLAAIDSGSGRTIGWRAGERFAMCSTFKLPLAAAILARVDAGELDLGDPVPYTEADLLDYAPVARARLAAGAARAAMSLEDACAAAVVWSDNTAGNLLLARVGGPAGLTAFLRAHGDAVTRLDRGEPTLNENLPGDPRDTTTPTAMAGTAQRLLLGDRPADAALSPASRERLAGWLVAAQPGRARLRAGLPADWRAGAKAGTGGNGAVNDVAAAWPPGRAPIVIACYVSEGTAPLAAREAAHREAARIVVSALG